MRTLATTVRALVIAAILVASSMAVHAQDEELPLPTHVTGTVVEIASYSGPDGNEDTGVQDTVTVTDEPGVSREAGHVLGQWVEWNDPRLPSEHWIRLDLAIYEDPEAGVMTMQTSHLLLGDEGSWRGTGRSLLAEDARDSYYELVGEGAYDGLSLLLRGTTGADAHAPWEVGYDGWIFEGEPAGFPDPAEPSDEEGFLVRKAPDPEATASAETPSDPMAPAAFVYTTEQVEEPDWGTDHHSAEGSVSESRGTMMVDRIEATDPRASGLLRSSDNRTQIELDDGVVQTWSVALRLTNDGGSWSGSGPMIFAHTDQVMQFTGLLPLTGEGGYEGLTLYLSQSGDYLDQASWGLIFPTELVAPMPDPVGPVIE